MVHWLHGSYDSDAWSSIPSYDYEDIEDDVCPNTHFHNLDDLCIECDPNCQAYPDMDYCSDYIGCEKCDSGYFRAREDELEPFTCHLCLKTIPYCEQCEDGVYFDNISCKKCIDGYTLSDDGVQCMK